MDEIAEGAFRFLAKIVLELVFEIFFRVVCYVTGFVVIWILTLGRLPVAARSPYWNRLSRSPTSYRCWVDVGAGGRKVLHPDLISLVGLLVWAGVIVWLVLTTGKG